MSDRWAGFGQIGKSPACMRGAHGDCAHVYGAGGGFNPRRLRLEYGAGLCPCTCHSSCPVALEGKRLTVSPQAAGKSRDEIREIYLAESNARGLRAPREDVLDAVVDQITGNPLPAARLAVEHLAQMGKKLHELSRIFR